MFSQEFFPNNQAIPQDYLYKKYVLQGRWWLISPTSRMACRFYLKQMSYVFSDV